MDTLTFIPTVTPTIFVSIIALIVSIISMVLSYHFWSKSFRPIVTAMVKTHSAGNVCTTFNLELLNSGSLPAKNIRIFANEQDLIMALGEDATPENKKRWLCCFNANSSILNLHNGVKISCSFGTAKAENKGFWKYKAIIPIEIEYEGWFGKKYLQSQ